MSDALRVAVVGAAGRMGAELLELITDATQLELGAALVPRARAGSELGSARVVARSDIAGGVADSDVVVDFSTPAGFSDALEAAVTHLRPFVSGTTGLSSAHHAAVERASATIPVLVAANFSVGVHVVARLTRLAAEALEGFDIEIFEAHHRNKVDAPSGTALFLGEAAAAGRGVDLDASAVWSRRGTSKPRGDEEIGFQVLRGGSIVGEHTSFFCGAGERVEITHRAQDRRIFAAGALRAARWLIERPPGLYTMDDVLFGEG